jgi:hypothetical protein
MECLSNGGEISTSHPHIPIFLIITSRVTQKLQSPMDQVIIETHQEDR